MKKKRIAQGNQGNELPEIYKLRPSQLALDCRSNEYSLDNTAESFQSPIHNTTKITTNSVSTSLLFDKVTVVPTSKREPKTRKFTTHDVGSQTDAQPSNSFILTEEEIMANDCVTEIPKNEYLIDFSEYKIDEDIESDYWNDDRYKYFGAMCPTLEESSLGFRKDKTSFSSSFSSSILSLDESANSDSVHNFDSNILRPIPVRINSNDKLNSKPTTKGNILDFPFADQKSMVMEAPKSLDLSINGIPVISEGKNEKSKYLSETTQPVYRVQRSFTQPISKSENHSINERRLPDSVSFSKTINTRLNLSDSTSVDITAGQAIDSSKSDSSSNANSHNSSNISTRTKLQMFPNSSCLIEFVQTSPHASERTVISDLNSEGSRATTANLSSLISTPDSTKMAVSIQDDGKFVITDYFVNKSSLLSPTRTTQYSNTVSTATNSIYSSTTGGYGMNTRRSKTVPIQSKNPNLSINPLYSHSSMEYKNVYGNQYSNNGNDLSRYNNYSKNPMSSNLRLSSNNINSSYIEKYNLNSGNRILNHSVNSSMIKSDVGEDKKIPYFNDRFKSK